MWLKATSTPGRNLASVHAIAATDARKIRGRENVSGGSVETPRDTIAGKSAGRAFWL
jgi:hypothetical protein